MITTKTVKIKIPDDVTNEYIENSLKSLGYDILRWAITDNDGDFYVLDIAIVE